MSVMHYSVWDLLLSLLPYSAKAQNVLVNTALEKLASPVVVLVVDPKKA